MFWTSLERTGAGYFDFYLLHNLGDTRTQSFDDFGIWDFLAEQKQKEREKEREEQKVREIERGEQKEADYPEAVSDYPYEMPQDTGLAPEVRRSPITINEPYLAPCEKELLSFVSLRG